MMNDNWVEQLSNGMYRAMLNDLPDVEYRGWTPAMKNNGLRPEDAPLKRRRPTMRELTPVCFPQTWGSTALGYDGIGGAAMTTALTVVVEFGGCFAVYFGEGVLAYLVDRRTSSEEQFKAFTSDMAARNLHGCRESVARYGAMLKGSE